MKTTAYILLSVLTVDHGLRRSSRAEALMVARMAASLALPHTILTWKAADAHGTSLQAKARTARYDLMAEHCQANDIPALRLTPVLKSQLGRLLSQERLVADAASQGAPLFVSLRSVWHEDELVGLELALKASVTASADYQLVVHAVAHLDAQGLPLEQPSFHSRFKREAIPIALEHFRQLRGLQASLPQVPFGDNFEEALPAFLTITAMTFTFSISKGIGFGFISYCIIIAVNGKWREVHPIIWIVCAIFVLYFIFVANLL
jgi:hypothetical protein